MSDRQTCPCADGPQATVQADQRAQGTQVSHCGWAALGESHSEHVAELVRSAFHRSRGLDTRPPERAILLDLIAQLREHCREPSCGCDIGRAADYAETRLRRLRDD